MKKSLLSIAFLGAFSAGANATVLSFVEPDSDVVEFDGLDFSVSVASATQTDAAPFGTIAGAEGFVEIGGLSTISMNLNGGVNTDSGVGVLGGEYEIFVEYSLSGTADLIAGPFPAGPGALGFTQLITMASGSATFYLEEGAVDGVFSGAAGAGVTELMTASLNNTFSSCTLTSTFDAAAAPGAGDSEVSVLSGGCTANLSIDSVTSGYFFADGMDWSVLSAIDIIASLDLTDTVDRDAIEGLFFYYADEEVVAGEGDGNLNTQDFTIQHDGSVSFVVPEPMTLGAFGLGLMCLAGFSRRRG